MGHPGLQEQILQSALAQFPVIGAQLGHPQGLSGATVGVVVGIAGALYGGLGVGQAVQNGMDTLWAGHATTGLIPSGAVSGVCCCCSSWARR